MDLHEPPISGDSTAQKQNNVKKSHPENFDSIVFYVPIDGLSNINSIDLVTSSKVLSSSNAALKTAHPVYVVSSKSSGTSNSVHSSSECPLQPVDSSIISSSGNPLTCANTSEVVHSLPNAQSIVRSKSCFLPSVTRPIAAALNKNSKSASSPAILFGPYLDLLSPSPKPFGILSESNTSPINKNVAVKPQVKRPAVEMVSTLVFFDLETTGLAHEIGKTNVQITEVSMIAMRRKDFQNSTSTELKDIRVIQKVCLCTRPRSSISYGAARVTGLKDALLVDQQPFDQNAAAVITTFLAHLPKPLCLIAHNGALYDFPLLKAEFNKLSIQLPSDILIADTLKAFRELGVPVFPPERKIAKSVKYGKQGKISYALDNLHLYFFNKKPVGSHSSEGDCIALAKVCHGMKDLMLPWIDENCSTIDSVVPMW